MRLTKQCGRIPRNLNLIIFRSPSENVINLKQMEPVPLKPLAPPTTERPAYQETSLKPLQLNFNGMHKCPCDLKIYSIYSELH